MTIVNQVAIGSRTCRIEYEDIDDFSLLPKEHCTQVYGVCFCDDKLVIAHNGKKGTWGLVGGTIEPGETYEQTMRREIQEESNMEVLSWQPVGYQKIVFDDNGQIQIQLRVVCRVRPYGEFTGDTVGSVDQIKLIDAKDYKQYFDWFEIGDRIMDRSLELLPNI